MDIGVISSLWLLQIKLLRALVHIFVSLCGPVLSLPLSKYLGEEWLGHVIGELLTF